MKRISISAQMFLVASIAGQAQSADNGIAALDRCFKASRMAYAICANPSNSSEQRSECAEKAQEAQLECIEHISSAAATEPSAPPDTASTATSQKPTNPDEAAANPAPTPAAPPPVAVAPPSSPVIAAPAAPTAMPPPSTLELTPDAPAKELAQSTRPAAAEPARPVTRPDAPVPGPAKRASTDWTLSETTSPIDYSPVVVATMKSLTTGKDMPTTLSLLCRAKRTVIAVGTDGRWTVGPDGKTQVSFQVRDAAVTSLWDLSANGKTVSVSDAGAADLLNVLSDGARLNIVITDGSEHAGTFQLAGLTAVRKRIFAACRSAPIVDSKASLPKR